MNAVQLAPTGQSTQVISVFLRKVTFENFENDDVSKDSFSRVYVPCAHGIQRIVPIFAITFTLAFMQLTNNDEIR